MLKELLESLDHQELVASQETLAHLDHLDYRSVTATPSILLCVCVRVCACVHVCVCTHTTQAYEAKR